MLLACCLLTGTGSRRKLVDELSSGDEGDCDEDHQHAASMPTMDVEEVNESNVIVLWLTNGLPVKR